MLYTLRTSSPSIKFEFTIVNVYSFFQLDIKNTSVCFKELLRWSKLMIIDIKIVSDFRISFLKCVQHLFNSFYSMKFEIFIKKTFCILKIVKHINH